MCTGPTLKLRLARALFVPDPGSTVGDHGAPQRPTGGGRLVQRAASTARATAASTSSRTARCSSPGRRSLTVATQHRPSWVGRGARTHMSFVRMSARALVVTTHSADHAPASASLIQLYPPLPLQTKTPTSTPTLLHTAGDAWPGSRTASPAARQCAPASARPAAAPTPAGATAKTPRLYVHFGLGSVRLSAPSALRLAGHALSGAPFLRVVFIVKK